MIHGARPYYQDRLVIRFQLPDGRVAFQGKRLPKRLQGILTQEEVRAYVEKGTVQAVQLIRGRIGSLAEAKTLLDSVRGGIWSQGRALP